MLLAMQQLLCLFFGLALMLLAGAEPGHAQSTLFPKTDHVRASLVPERPAIAPGATVTIALREEILDKWHTYWINPGDAGAPTSIDWRLPPGWTNPLSCWTLATSG